MGSTSIKLAKAMKTLQNLKQVQRAATSVDDPYMVGFFNGMELAMATMTGKEPEFITCSKEGGTMEEEVYHCTQCGEEHTALTQEIKSYLCPKMLKSKDNRKVLDQVRIKYLTVKGGLSKTQDPKKNIRK